MPDYARISGASLLLGYCAQIRNPSKAPVVSEEAEEDGKVKSKSNVGSLAGKVAVVIPMAIATVVALIEMVVYGLFTLLLWPTSGVLPKLFDTVEERFGSAACAFAWGVAASKRNFTDPILPQNEGYFRIDLKARADAERYKRVTADLKSINDAFPSTRERERKEERSTYGSPTYVGTGGSNGTSYGSSGASYGSKSFPAIASPSKSPPSSVESAPREGISSDSPSEPYVSGAAPSVRLPVRPKEGPHSKEEEGKVEANEQADRKMKGKDKEKGKNEAGSSASPCTRVKSLAAKMFPIRPQDWERVLADDQFPDKIQSSNLSGPVMASVVGRYVQIHEDMGRVLANSEFRQGFLNDEPGVRLFIAMSALCKTIKNDPNTIPKFAQMGYLDTDDLPTTLQGFYDKVRQSGSFGQWQMAILDELADPNSELAVAVRCHVNKLRNEEAKAKKEIEAAAEKKPKRKVEKKAERSSQSTTATAKALDNESSPNNGAPAASVAGESH